jgi:hypothetical protein
VQAGTYPKGFPHFQKPLRGRQHGSTIHRVPPCTYSSGCWRSLFGTETAASTATRVTRSPPKLHPAP